MGRGSRVGVRSSTRRPIKAREKDSDESDEEYKVGEDEECEESDEYCSLDGDESEEVLADFEEEETKVKRIVRSRQARKSSPAKKADQIKKPWKKRRVSYKEEDDDDEYCSLDGDESEEILADFEEEEEEKKVKRVVGSRQDRKSSPVRKADQMKKPRKKRRVSYREEDENEDEDDDDYEDDVEDDDGEDEDGDEEFMLDESDCVDDEDEMLMKEKKVSRQSLRKKGFSKGKRKSRKSKVLKSPMRQKPRKKGRSMRRRSSTSGGEVANKRLFVEEKSKKIYGRRRRRRIPNPDSDFVSSGSSDYEYTISEEEREQIREASKFCTDLKISLRSSSENQWQEEKTICQQRKRTVRKGKEKVEETKAEVGNQVCGICLSEEGKRTVRGSLNCCSHYFCFACIMEWSKVESRCPLCKQRFMTISKPAKSNTGFDLRTVVIQVPERDQVYQPSEEELRAFLDPYENVICTECHRGGDDNFMLLCDICDSPAHTFCVDLGYEVPEGNWYCRGCRPSVFGSPDGRASNDEYAISSPVFGGIDLNELYVPETPLTQETGVSSSFRRPTGDLHAASPASGPGAFTLSDRRRIQHQIHHLILNNGRSSGTSASSSGIRLFGSELNQGVNLRPQQTPTSERVSHPHTFPGRRLEDNTRPSMRNIDLSSAISSHFRGQGENSTMTSVDRSVQAEHGGGLGISLNSRLVYDQLYPCTNRSVIGSDASPSPSACREVSNFNIEKGQVQQMVKSHLKTLSRDIKLGCHTFKDIAKRSTHTILAACGLEHRPSLVYSVHPTLTCNHVGELARTADISIMKGYCSSCFDLFVKEVVVQIIDVI